MSKKDKILFFVFFIIIISSSLTVLANEQYSYEKAEELTPLIEWNDYGPEAFQKAFDEDKPIFLLLTAPSWCYWCQVYESEEYLFHPDIIEYVNGNFVPVYVNADKRQDLTRKYLEGGWPSTTIMTPGKERLFGFSGVRPIPWMLTNLKGAVDFVSSNDEIIFFSYDYEKKKPVIPKQNELLSIVNWYPSSITYSYDSTFGGFGTGQKFPQGRSLDFSLEIYELSDDEKYLNIVENTLNNQYTDINELKDDYNLYDPVEGGFHRYGTKRDWTPPHFEKMLYDNVRLLKAYAHLQQINPDNILVNDVVDGTLNYIKNNWYDAEEGGFYGNTDVNGEEAYYGSKNRGINGELPLARVEKTKFTDWNSEAIMTYLYLFSLTGEDEYKGMAKDSLDFFAKEMISVDNGAYHYIDENEEKESFAEKGLQGNLLDNAYLMLAFIEGYDVLEDESYLQSAQQLADYSLDNFYDWNSGGFFERNSPNKEMYTPGEEISLSKPTPENGVISLAMLKLYSATDNIEYLNSAVKTIGLQLKNIGGLDRSYYNIKSIQYLLSNNLLTVYDDNSELIEDLEIKELENFWLNEMLEEQAELMSSTDLDNVLNSFSLSNEKMNDIQGSFVLLMLIALFAGFLSFLSPCSLPILPAYLAYSFKSSKENFIGITLMFFLGLSLVFTILGLTATFIGQLLRSKIDLFSQISGVILMLFGLYILTGKGFSGIKIRPKKPTTYFSALIFGMVLGISWTPCTGPILVALLILASASGSVFSGGLLLFIYAIGLSLPLILLSNYVQGLDKNESKLWEIMRGKEFKFKFFKKSFNVHSSTLISGLLFLMLGYLIFTGKLIVLNQLLGTSKLQVWIYTIEEWLLSFAM